MRYRTCPGQENPAAEHRIHPSMHTKAIFRACPTGKRAPGASKRRPKGRSCNAFSARPELWMPPFMKCSCRPPCLPGCAVRILSEEEAIRQNATRGASFWGSPGSVVCCLGCFSNTRCALEKHSTFSKAGGRMASLEFLFFCGFGWNTHSFEYRDSILKKGSDCCFSLSALQGRRVNQPGDEDYGNPLVNKTTIKNTLMAINTPPMAFT